MHTGIVDRYERDQALPTSEQYLRHIRMESDVKVAVTMNSLLAQLVHRVQYLVCDFTFKRLRGELNEWEVAVWCERLQESMSPILNRDSDIIDIL